MKSYNHLWEQFIADDNIDLAIRNALRGKRNRASVKKYIENPNFHEIIKDYAEHFKNAKHKPKQIYDGIQRKKRTIIVPNFKEQVIHHMAVNVLKPIFQKSMYYHSYGSLPNKGGHKGARFIRKWIDKDFNNCRYCLKMDIRKYFENIPHEILKRKLSRLIHDKQFLAVLYEIIDVCDYGIPLGFYTSQWFANWYLTELDNYIKETLKAEHYIRYMDDMVVFGESKEILHFIRKMIVTYLYTKLGLDMKDNWAVFPINKRPLDFMGFRFYPNRTTLRKSIMMKASRKAKRLWKKDKPMIHDIRQMLSYNGWLLATSTYRFYIEHIKPFIDFGKLKQRISNYDRRINQCLVNG